MVHDEESGLHYNRYRYDDPAAGRFISTDPEGLDEGWNLFQYAPNAINWLDPLGLKKQSKTYVTYTKKNTKTGEVYSGRSSGVGDPNDIVAKRDAGHHVNGNYGPAKLDKSSKNKRAIRGREQQLIKKHGGAKSEGGTSGNAINGVSPKNKDKDKYEQAANDEFGPKKKGKGAGSKKKGKGC